MVGRVEAGGTDIPDRSGLLVYAVNLILRAECVTVVLDQEEAVLYAEFLYCL